MSKASIETYLIGLNSDKTTTDASRVYRYVKRNPNCTKNYVIKHLGLSHQTVTARLSDLLDMGVIEIVGTQALISSTVSLFKIQENMPKIINNAYERRKTKFTNWKKKGLNTFKEMLSPEIINQLENA